MACQRLSAKQIPCKPLKIWVSTFAEQDFSRPFPGLHDLETEDLLSRLSEHCSRGWRKLCFSVPSFTLVVLVSDSQRQYCAQTTSRSVCRVSRLAQSAHICLLMYNKICANSFNLIWYWRESVWLHLWSMVTPVKIQGQCDSPSLWARSCGR